MIDTDQPAAAIQRVPEISPERENFRVVQLAPKISTHRRDPVEPVPVGSYVARVFRVTGYDPDCDGSLMARLESVDATGEGTGWESTNLALYPDTSWLLDGPDALDRAAQVTR